MLVWGVYVTELVLELHVVDPGGVVVYVDLFEAVEGDGGSERETIRVSRLALDLATSAGLVYQLHS